MNYVLERVYKCNIFDIDKLYGSLYLVIYSGGHRMARMGYSITEEEYHMLVQNNYYVYRIISQENRRYFDYDDYMDSIAVTYKENDPNLKSKTI